MQTLTLLILLFLPTYFLVRLAIIVVGYYVQRRKIGYLPKPSYMFPFLAQLMGHGDIMWKMNDEMKEKFPDVDFFDMGPDPFGHPIVAVNNLDIAKEIFNDEKFPKAIESSLIIKKLIGQGMVASEGHLWKKERRVLSPGFHFATLRETIPTIVVESRKFVEELKDLNGAPVEAKKTFTSITLRVIIATAFGGEFDSEWMAKKWFEVFDNLPAYAICTTFFGRLADYIPISSRFSVALDQIAKKSKEFIARRRQIPAENQSKSDVVGLLLHSGETNDDLIVDEAKTFLLAGHETTSNLLAWTCCFLSQHPDVQEKAYQEVMAVLGDREPTAEDIPKLKYCKAILEESLRMRPIVTFLPARYNPSEVTLAGKTFPAKTSFLINILGAQANEKYWTKADQYIPERFLDDGKDMRKHSYAFIAFSAGARNCIGQKFSLQEGAIIISMILRDFRITLEGKPHPISKPTLTPVGANLRFLPRK